MRPSENTLFCILTGVIKIEIQLVFMFLSMNSLDSLIIMIY